MSRRKSAKNGKQASPVITRKMTPEEREYADKTALKGLKGIYSKYDCNHYYGKDDMQAVKTKIDELKAAQGDEADGNNN